jgi:hypothetical protein
MATRFYFHDAAPANDPGETENSTVLPTVTAAHFQDFGIAVKSMNTTIGTAETSVTGSSRAHTDADQDFFTSFSSPAIATQTITAQTWTIAVDVDEGNANANSFMVLSVYVFREPSTIVGFIYDSATQLGNEWNNVGRGRVATFSGASVSATEGDYIVCEFWRDTAGQAMAMAYVHELFYDGTVDVTEGSSTSAASYLETPQTITFPVGAGWGPLLAQERNRLIVE